MSRPKILYVSPNGYLGGAERFVLTAAASHAKTADFTPFIVFFGDGEAVAEARKMNLNVRVLSTTFRLTDPRRLLKALGEIRAIVHEIRPDIIHTTMAYAQLVLGLAFINGPKKLVWFQHGPVGGRLDFLASLFPTDLLLFNSSYLRELHHRSFPHSRFQREAVIPLGVASAPAPRALFKNRKVVFGAAGRVTPFKAFEDIIRSLSGLTGEFEFHLAGAPKIENDRAYEQRLRELVVTLRLSERVRFLGHVDNMSEFYRSLDVFIHSAQAPEPFGLVIAEAMGQGCLAVGKNEGGARDFLLPEKTALTYSTTPELVAQLQRILNSGDTLNGIAARGHGLIHENYRIEKMNSKLEGLYRSLLH